MNPSKTRSKTPANLSRFAELVTRDQFGLAEACLLIAEDQYPEVDIGGCIAQLDAMAAAVRSRLAADAFPEQKVALLNHHLFAELRFSGNVDAYYDPRNSYLNEVLARRTGIPITLSVVYLEVGRRLGLSLHGVSFPGHFLVRLRLKRGDLLLDPFTGGEPRTERELRERLGQVVPAARGAHVDLQPYLEPATPRQIVTRVLRNLKAIYLQAGELEAALAASNRLLLVMPERAEELRDRGLLYARMECFRPAAADLQNYLRRAPDAPDATDMHEKLVELKHAIGRLN
jgi:regulator of sirC expression with transglutaminase-like and TPR domain